MKSIESGRISSNSSPSEGTVIKLTHRRKGIKVGKHEIYLPPTREHPYVRLVQRVSPAEIKVSRVIPLERIFSAGEYPDPRTNGLMESPAGKRTRKR